VERKTERSKRTERIKIQKDKLRKWGIWGKYVCSSTNPLTNNQGIWEIRAAELTVTPLWHFKAISYSSPRV